MILYPVKIYKPNKHGDIEYVETIPPDTLSKIHWDKFNRDTGQLNLHSNYKPNQSYENTQAEE